MLLAALFMIGLVVVACVWGSGVLLSLLVRDVRSILHGRNVNAPPREELEQSEEDR